MVADAEAIRQNFVSKELQNRTVPPGQSVSGFVYYQLPKDHPKSGTAYFKISLPSTTGNEPVDFEFPLIYETH